MTDSTPNTPALTDADHQAIASAVADLIDTEKLAENVVATIKKSGVSGLAALAPAVVPQVQKDIADAKAALPAIKSGYKTTEFWLWVSIPVANAIYFRATGKVLPFDLNVVFATGAAIYNGFRAVAKANATTARG